MNAIEIERTSLSHPLAIAEVAVPGGGRIGVTFCPGKRQQGAATGAWARDLGIDLDAVRAWGAGVVLTLTTEAKLKALKVEGLGHAVRERGMQWLHLPIQDVHPPDAVWERRWADERRCVQDELDRDGAVLVHCKGGLGRAGMIAALILVERGLGAETAIEAVRRARGPGAIETQAQARFVRAATSLWPTSPSAGAVSPTATCLRWDAARPNPSGV